MKTRMSISKFFKIYLVCVYALKQSPKTNLETYNFLNNYNLQESLWIR